MTPKIINYTIPEITWYIYIYVGCSTLIGEYKVHICALLTVLWKDDFLHCLLPIIAVFSGIIATWPT